MKPSNIRFLNHPAKPFRINEYFGENTLCVIQGGTKITSKTGGKCPKGFVPLYPSGGHTGLDLAAERYQKLYAATEGVVEEKATEEARGLGIGIITTQKHWCEETQSFEYMKVRYWHLIQLDVDLGDVVKMGDYIGLAENTGYSTRDHLHFELKPVRKNAKGEWYNVLQDNGTNGGIDPLPYMNNIYALDAVAILRRLQEMTAVLFQMLADITRYGKTY